MSEQKPRAGEKFPDLHVQNLKGGTLDLSSFPDGCDWRLIVIYRGKHCPICTTYLTTLNGLLDDFRALGVDVVAISGDPKEKAHLQIDEINPDFAVGYGLTIEQMQTLGLYISDPRSPKETDRPFPEPGLFVVNADGDLQIVDISNAPFTRPDLNALLRGLTFVRNPDNNYPIRGTYQ